MPNRRFPEDSTQPAAGHLLRLAHYIEALPPDRWPSRPAARSHPARAGRPFPQDTARFLNLPPSVHHPELHRDQAEAVRLLCGD